MYQNSLHGISNDIEPAFWLTVLCGRKINLNTKEFPDSVHVFFITLVVILFLEFSSLPSTKPGEILVIFIFVPKYNSSWRTHSVIAVTANLLKRFRTKLCVKLKICFLDTRHLHVNEQVLTLMPAIIFVILRTKWTTERKWEKMRNN